LKLTGKMDHQRFSPYWISISVRPNSMPTGTHLTILGRMCLRHIKARLEKLTGNPGHRGDQSNDAYLQPATIDRDSGTSLDIITGITSTGGLILNASHSPADGGKAQVQAHLPTVFSGCAGNHKTCTSAR
jgi:hypothetical protein